MTAIKKFVTAILFAFLISPIYSQESTNLSDIQRVNIQSDIMTQEQQSKLNNEILKTISTLKFDLPVYIKDSFDESIAGFGKSFYETNNFGYGKNKDGLMLLIGTDTEQIHIRGFGSGKMIFDKSKIAEATDLIRTAKENGNSWDSALLSYVSFVNKTLSETDRTPYDSMTFEETEKHLPAWYPENIGAFEDFHDLRASRVIDDAHIFSPEQINEMKKIINSIQEKYKTDLVVFTDSSSYGFEHGLYAADFHQFCGYGFGDDFTGSVLFICMEPDNRGWWTAATGEIEDVYTSYTINELDDKLEPFMIGGKYGEGVIDYLNNIYNLYELPEWYPENTKTFASYLAENRPHVVDMANCFTPEQKSDLTALVDKVSNDYNAEVVILTIPRLFRNWHIADYTKAYLKYNGYGDLETSDYCVLGYFKDNKKSGWDIVISPNGKNRRKKNIDHLKRAVNHPIEKDIFKGSRTFATRANSLYKFGIVAPHIRVIPIIFWGTIGSIIAAVIYVFSLISKMGNVSAATEADQYLEKDSFVLETSDDKYVSEHTKKIDSGSSGRSSGGSGSSGGRSRSTYSSHYSSSGGRSYSGGGRRF